MNEQQFLANLKALNSGSIEDFYVNSLPEEKRVGFQVTLFKLLIRNYSILMVIYAFVFTIFANIIGLINPSKSKEVPDILAKSLPVKTWYQGDKPNSSVVAVIKAVQAKYGTNIFNKKTVGFDKSFQIELKDGYKINISFDEINLVKKLADFRGPEIKDKEYAYLAFAVMAKNAFQRGDFVSFKAALNYFNAGSYPEYCSEMLGFIRLTMKTDPLRGLNDVVVAYSKTQAVCINNGFIEGQSEKLLFAGHDTMGSALSQAILIV